MTIDEAKEKLERDTFTIDALYTFYQLKERLFQEKMTIIWILSEIFLIIYSFLKHMNIKIATAYGVIIFALYFITSIIYNYTKIRLEEKWTGMKINMSKDYLSRIDGIKDMESWVIDKIYESELAPCAGLKLTKNNEN